MIIKITKREARVIRSSLASVAQDEYNEAQHPKMISALRELKLNYSAQLEKLANKFAVVNWEN